MYWTVCSVLFCSHTTLDSRKQIHGLPYSLLFSISALTDKARVGRGISPQPHESLQDISHPTGLTLRVRSAGRSRAPIVQRCKGLPLVLRAMFFFSRSTILIIQFSFLFVSSCSLQKTFEQRVTPQKSENILCGSGGVPRRVYLSKCHQSAAAVRCSRSMHRGSNTLSAVQQLHTVLLSVLGGILEHRIVVKIEGWQKALACIF